jgi:signal transduction histidine kinase
LANGLHPPVLTEQGLSDALADLVRDVPLPVSLDVTKAPLPAPVAAAVYFICAEALSNAAKHAAASHVTVVVTTSDGRIDVKIADDGVGGADASRGSGLRGLADRVEVLRGRLQVDSVPGDGTRLTAEIPLGGETNNRAIS